MKRNTRHLSLSREQLHKHCADGLLADGVVRGHRLNLYDLTDERKLLNLHDGEQFILITAVGHHPLTDLESFSQRILG